MIGCGVNFAPDGMEGNMAENHREKELPGEEARHSGIYPGSGAYPEVTEDETARSEINRERNAEEAGVEQSDELKDSERLPRKGDEIEEVLD
jgi:hypothetical protein